MRSFSILYFSFHSLDDTIARVDLARRRKLEHFCVCSFFIVLCNTLSLCVAAVLFPLPVTTSFFSLSFICFYLSYLKSKQRVASSCCREECNNLDIDEHHTTI